MNRRIELIVFAALAVACESGTAEVLTSPIPDAGTRDAGARDAGARDGGADEGLHDGGARDGGVHDAGLDAGIRDGAAPLCGATVATAEIERIPAVYPSGVHATAGGDDGFALFYPEATPGDPMPGALGLVLRLPRTGPATEELIVEAAHGLFSKPLAWPHDTDFIAFEREYVGGEHWVRATAIPTSTVPYAWTPGGGELPGGSTVFGDVAIHTYGMGADVRAYAQLAAFRPDGILIDIPTVAARDPRAVPGFFFPWVAVAEGAGVDRRVVLHQLDLTLAAVTGQVVGPNCPFTDYDVVAVTPGIFGVVVDCPDSTIVHAVDGLGATLAYERLPAAAVPTRVAASERGRLGVVHWAQGDDGPTVGFYAERLLVGGGAVFERIARPVPLPAPEVRTSRQRTLSIAAAHAQERDEPIRWIVSYGWDAVDLYVARFDGCTP